MMGLILLRKSYINVFISNYLLAQTLKILNKERIMKDTLQNLEERFEAILVGSANVELIEAYAELKKELAERFIKLRKQANGVNSDGVNNYKS